MSAERWLAAFAVISVGFSLVARILYRGPYYPGWEVLGPVHGTFLLSTQPFWQVVDRVFESTRAYRFWNNSNSLLYTIIPGLLNQVLPWQYWGEVVTFAVVAAGIALAVRVAGLSWRQSWIALLACGASPVLLSFALMGYPSATTVLPHALALWTVTSESCRRSWWLAALLGLLTIELSWHLYEGGRMIFLVWILAAALLPSVRLPTRLVWVALAGVQIEMLDRFRAAATDDVRSSLASIWSAEALARAALVVGDKLYVHPSLSLPTLATLMVASLFLVKKDRLFWIGAIGAQLFVLLLLANLSPGQLIARRYVTFEFYCLVATLVLVRHLVSGEVWLQPRFVPSARRAALAALVLGNLAQIAATLLHLRLPVAANEHPLPFTYAVDDLKVHGRHVDWSMALYERVKSGRKLILLYNFTTWAEWATDPVATLERLYLRLGPQRYRDSVVVFAAQSCRPTCLPMFSAQALPQILDWIADGAMGPVEDFEVHYLASDPARDLPGAADLIRARFVHGPEEGDGFARRFPLLAARADKLDFSPAGPEADPPPASPLPGPR